MERPELFADPVVIQRRVNRFCDALGLRADRVVAWAFAQAVPSAIWATEDEPAKPTVHSSLRLAEALAPEIHHVLESNVRSAEAGDLQRMIDAPPPSQSDRQLFADGPERDRI